MSWLSDLTEQYAEFESPLSFYQWSALAALSAVLKDSVYVDRYLYKLYPNVYIMLHAESGLKKGPPISMAKQLVSEVKNTKVISGRSSIQGIMKEMGMAVSQPGGKISSSSSAFICSSELSASIVSDPAATGILTDLYDRIYNVDDYASLLKMESFKLNKPVITMLTGTNESMGTDFFTRKEVMGGFIARTFVIYETKRNVVNSLIYEPKVIPDPKKSAEYLKEVAKLKGPFAPLQNTPAGDFYFNWYHEFTKAVDKLEEKDTTGTLNRFGDSVLKVGMLLTIANEPTLVMPLEAIEQAVKYCEQLVGNVRKTTLGSSELVSVESENRKRIINELLRRDGHLISKQQLNRKYWMNASSKEWDDIMFSLEEADLVAIQTQGNVVMYQMSEKNVEEWNRHFKGKV